MKKLSLTALLPAAGIPALCARTFVAADRAKDRQAFNASKAFTYAEDGKSLSGAFGDGENKGLRRDPASWPGRKNISRCNE